MSGVPGQDDIGGNVGAAGPGTDVTDRMPTDDIAALLVDSPETARQLLEHLSAGLGYFDADGNLVAGNQELERLLGQLPERADDIRFRPLHATDPGARASPIARALTGESVVDEELEVMLPDGSHRWVRVSAQGVGDGEVGELAGSLGVVLLALDVGEARNLEVIATQVLAVIAHDLRNPLSALRMTAAMMTKQQEMTTARRIELAERMLGTIGRMEGLVSSLIEHAQSDRGIQLRLQREPADLEQIYNSVKRDLDVLFPGRAIEVRRSGRLDGFWDSGRLARVLSNLLINALKHGDDSSPVVLTLDGSAEDTFRFSVSNQGVPIPPEFLPHAFQAFTVGPSQLEGRRRSVGLGLFIVEHLVNAHGGQVSVTSSAEGGTTVTVTLPRR